MKNTIKTLLAVAVLGAASSVSAALIPDEGIVTITDTVWDGNPSVNGGELDADFANGHQAYTFCVEPGVSLKAGYSGDYKYKLEDGVTKGTAYLVKLFALGQLYVQDFGIQGGTHDLSAGKLQNAIWHLEGIGGAFNDYVQMAIDAFGLAVGDAYTDGEVKVVDLYAYKDVQGAWIVDDSQDQVVYIPDSGATLALLGLALGGLAIARRRR